MKTTKIKLALLIAVVAPFLAGCPKAKNDIAPEPDKEFQSSVDASLANFMVTDIDMVCSFVGENDLHPKFYWTAPDEDESKIMVVRDINDDHLTVSYYNKARCMDGKVREGSIFMFYSNTDPNAKYYRDFNFYGRIKLVDFRVDGWLISNADTTPCYVYNRVNSPGYDPSKTNLTWLIDGSFTFTHPTDPSKNMVWTGKLTKTLVNTSDHTVFDPSKQRTINWSKAIVEYRGEATGLTSGNVPFKMSINDFHPLTRDFGCYPNAVSGLTSVQPLKTWSEEFHPVKSGIASFTTGDKYPRQIYYGNENNPELSAQCDNSGEVLIKGISYRIDFVN